MHHFAHRPPVTCSLGIGETERHLDAKLEIYDSLKSHPNVDDAEIEKDFGISVADVYASISGVRVAIEIQRTPLSVNDLALRTQNYHRLGIAVLWIGLPNGGVDTKRYSPRAWEKWVHAAYYGRVYYWMKGEVLKVYHFSRYMICVEESNWYENGVEQSGGGYERKSKRWRTPEEGSLALISTSFESVQRHPWSCGSVSVPECTLYIDKQPNWWK